jgi:hypothetical protein
MRIISATILDATHLELSQPLSAKPGDVIQISFPSVTDDETAVWRAGSALGRGAAALAATWPDARVLAVDASGAMLRQMPDSAAMRLQADVRRLVDDGLPKSLEPLLDDDEQDALLRRARAVADVGVFPIDGSGRRYPRPLV